MERYEATARVKHAAGVRTYRFRLDEDCRLDAEAGALIEALRCARLEGLVERDAYPEQITLVTLIEAS